MEQPDQSPKKSRKLILIIGAAILIAGAAYYYLSHSGGYQTTDNAQIDGNIITVKARVGSYVDEILFNDNQQVQIGDTLIILNTVELQAKVEQAKAALANAQAGIKVSDSKAVASVENASASLELARSNDQAVNAATSNLNRAKEEHDRSQKLLAVKGITQQQFEASRNQLEIAQADLQQAINRRQSSLATAQGQKATARSEKAQIGTAQALVEQRKAELAMAEYELSHAYVLAPCGGTVTKRSVQEGNFVAAGQNLFAIVDVGNLWVTANVKENQLNAIRIGQPVEIEVDAYPGLHLNGKVNSFGGATGAKFSLLPPDNATGNFVKIIQRVPVRITLDQPLKHDQNAPLFPGLSTEVKIKTK